jgi:hypothetical protein
VVARLGLGHERELVALPVEAAGVDHDAADAGAVAAHPLGEGVHDDVGAVIDGALQVGGGEGAVHDQRQAVGVGDVGDGGDVGHVQAGIADGLAEERLGLGVIALAKFSRDVGVHELHGDAELRQDVVELV